MKIRELIRDVKGHPSLELYDPHSIEELADHPEIEILTIQHFPRINRLDPIAKLTNLRSLNLHAQVSWGVTNRCLEVETFMPLANLKALEGIHVLGVVPKKDGVTPFARIKSLKRVVFGNSNFYQLEDFAFLSTSLPGAVNIRPIIQMNFITPCRACFKFPKLYLEGTKPRSRKYVCPSCHRNALLGHLERWNISGGQPQYSDCASMTPKELFMIFRNRELDAEWKRIKWKE